MSPKPIIENSKNDYDQNDERASDARIDYRADDPLNPARGIIVAFALMLFIFIALGCALVIWTQVAKAREGAAPTPVAAPQALVRAREACPLDKPLACRAALVHAYTGLAWAKKERLSLAREMVGKLSDWTCIHQGEGAWNANTGNGYHGGLQMDWGFMRTYGRDMLQRHAGRGAEAWTPREQIIVAQRAFAQGRGYAPWPNTSRMCGLR